MDTQSLAGTVISLGGVPFSGFGQNEAIDIVPDGPTFTSVVGVDGEKVRSYTGCESYKVTITLLPGSKANAALTAAFQVDGTLAKLGAGGAPLPFLWKGANLDLFVAPDCWVTMMPQVKGSNKVEDRVWQLETGRAKLFLGS